MRQGESGGATARAELGGSDLVQRLLARSSATSARPSARAEASRPRPARAIPRDPVADHDYAERDFAPYPDEDDSEEVTQLRAELRLVKAVLRSEREELTVLRDQLEQIAALRIPMDDVRLDRDRWANLVERLLFSERGSERETALR